jgi:iron(III) transport system substrate-binding protein
MPVVLRALGSWHGVPLCAVLVVSLAALGCTPPRSASPTPPSPPTVPDSAPAWQSHWEQTVAAARREGQVRVSGPLGAGYREPLTSLFEKAYPDIKVDFVSLGGANLWPRFNQERAGGIYLWDVLVNGHSPEVYKAKDRGDLDPVRSLLVLPEILDDSKWLGGVDGLFSDTAKRFVIGFFGSSAPSLHVNRDFVSESELAAADQLVAPAFRGRITTFDPRAGGPASGDMQVLLIAYGEGFITDLLSKQDLVVASEARQLTEWVVRGRYPIGFGLTSTNVKTFRESGVGLNVKPLAGPRSMGTSAGGIYVPTNRPHPNAAKVYVNWLLTQEAQSALAQGTSYNSRRLDATIGNPDEVVDPTRLSEYIHYQSEQLVPYRERVLELAGALLK